MLAMTHGTLTYNTKQDLENIKAQIKEWENKLDSLIHDKSTPELISEELEEIAHEMFAINF